MNIYEKIVTQPRKKQGNLSRLEAPLKKGSVKTHRCQGYGAKAAKKVKKGSLKDKRAKKITKVSKKTRAKWLKLRPKGCSKCRRKPGCTPSCWK